VTAGRSLPTARCCVCPVFRAQPGGRGRGGSGHLVGVGPWPRTLRGTLDLQDLASSGFWSNRARTAGSREHSTTPMEITARRGPDPFRRAGPLGRSVDRWVEESDARLDLRRLDADPQIGPGGPATRDNAWLSFCVTLRDSRTMRPARCSRSAWAISASSSTVAAPNCAKILDAKMGKG